MVRLPYLREFNLMIARRKLSLFPRFRVTLKSWNAALRVGTTVFVLLWVSVAEARKPVIEKAPSAVLITGRELASLEDEEIKGSGIQIARFSPDGSTVVAAGRKSLFLWSVDGGKLVLKTDLRIPPDAEVQEIAVAHSADRAALVIKDNKSNWIDVWDTSSAARVCTLNWPNATIGQITFTAKPDLLVVGLHPNQVKLLDTTAGGRELRTIPGQIDNIAASRDGKTIATSFGDRTMLWDVMSGELTREISAGGEIVMAENGRLALHQRGALGVWNTHKLRSRPSYLALKSARSPHRIRLAADGDLVAGVDSTFWFGSKHGLRAVLNYSDPIIWDLASGHKLADLIELAPDQEDQTVRPTYERTTIDWNFRDRNTLLGLSLEEFGNGREHAYAGGRVEGPAVYNAQGQGVRFDRIDGPGTVVFYNYMLKLREYDLGDLGRDPNEPPPKHKSRRSTATK